MRRKFRRFALSARLTGSRGQVDGRVEVERDFAQQPDGAHRDADARLHDGQRLARLSSVRRQSRADALAPGQQSVRRRMHARAHQRSSRITRPLAGRDIRLSARVSF